MKRSKVVMATSHVDAHHERLAPQALRSMVADVKAAYIPLWVEHDPRIPPVGRVIDAYIETGDDGELIVVGVTEEFGPGERPPFDASRRMKIGNVERELGIHIDRSYRDRQSQALLADIAQLLNVPVRPEGKKALEPVSVLTFVAKAALGKIAETFWSNVSDDAYRGVKRKLSLLFRRRRERNDDYVFRYKCSVVVGGREVEVDFLATAPSEERIERIFKKHLAEGDRVLQEYLPAHPEIARVVFDAGGPELKFSYAVRADVVPVFDAPSPGA